MLSAAEIRAEFALDPGVAHLNHGSFGACPLPVLARQEQLRLELEKDPVAFLARRLPAMLDEVRGVLAAYVGAVDPCRLVLLANSTTALNAVATSAALRPDDEVVVTDLEYGAMRLLWHEVARRTGARIVTAPIVLPVSTGEQIVEAIWRAVTPGTRILFFSHVTSETALVLPAAELCRRAGEAGILTVVDGAHGPGQLDLDLDALGADCYAGNAHKWLCAPKGSAFLYAREEVQAWLAPPVVSWGWRWDGEDAFQSRFSWGGTDDPTAVLSIPAALRFQAERRWPELRERCRDLARRTQARVLESLGGEAIAPPELQAPQMVSFPVPTDDPERLQAELRERFHAEVIVRQIGEQALLRLCVQAYTAEEECDRLVAALEALCRAPVSRNAKSR